jgi:AraC-like DNA-binding protein
MSPEGSFNGQMNRGGVVALVGTFIDEHYADGISLVHVARALHYSPAHLTYVVRKETGRPVTAWIVERRILAARELLLATDETVAAVAEAVGFRDVAYFSRRFARTNGTTPARFRIGNLPRRARPAACPTSRMRRSVEAVG